MIDWAEVFTAIVMLIPLGFLFGLVALLSWFWVKLAGKLWRSVRGDVREVYRYMTEPEKED